MSPLEKKLFLEACYWYKACDDAEPCPGIGPSYQSIVLTVARRVGLVLSPEDVGKFAEELRCYAG